jgi:hypothetical protein
MLKHPACWFLFGAVACWKNQFWSGLPLHGQILRQVHCTTGCPGAMIP